MTDGSGAKWSKPGGMSGPGVAMLSLGLHTASSERVTIVNDGRKIMAKRNYKEFNHGLVFSASPLPDDHLFQLHIDKKVIIFLHISTNDLQTY